MCPAQSSIDPLGYPSQGDHPGVPPVFRTAGRFRIACRRSHEEAFFGRADCADFGRGGGPRRAHDGAKYGVSEQTLYEWRRRYEGMDVSQVADLKRLQQENARLKKVVVEQHLALDIAQEALAKKS